MSAHTSRGGGVTLSLFATSGPAEGLFVTIDGPNGSGKTSIACEIEHLLSAAGHLVHSARQPSPSPIGALARDSEATVSGRALACLIAADRHQQMTTEVLPALHRGAVVVCDRYVESSLVLQRIDGVETEFILAANSGIRRPDLRVRLEAGEQILAARLAERPLRPERRFEAMSDSSAQELELYAAADALITERYAVPSLVLDTTSSSPREQASLVVDQIVQQLEARE